MPNVDERVKKGKAIKRVESPASEERIKESKGESETKEDSEEASGKIKSRSRFSAALRSISKSKTKKDKSADRETKSGAEEEEEADQTVEEEIDTPGDLLEVASSISTDSGAVGKTKKKSLTRRLLLGGLRKSGKTAKVRPHSLATSDDISLERVEASLPATPSSPSAASSTLQITISGKKVEPAVISSSKKTSKSRPKSTATETDYLTPAAGEKQKKKTTTTTVTTRDTSSTRTTTKLVVAKKKQQPQQLTTQQQQQQLPQGKLQERESPLITESTRDTPPRERAPAKPSRLQVGPTAQVVQSASGTGAVRKSVTSSSSKKLELMQQQQQRGHRLHTARNPNNQTTVAEPAIQEPAQPELEVTSSISTIPQVPDDGISSAESAQTLGQSSPVVRFAVGSAVRSPLSAYEAALAAAAANQQPSSGDEPSDSSLRRLQFAHQQQLLLSDHDSIEGRRETLHYQSVASEFQDSGSEEQESDDTKGTESAKPMPAFGDLTMDQEMEPAIMTSTSEKREHLYKILVIGELGTGKTSFIKRYVHQFFSQNYRATIGVDFALKVLQWDANTIVRLQLWDIAGQERFGNMTRVYYKEAVGAFIVFDVTRSGTFDCVSKWKEDLDSKVQLPDGSPIPCILLANKCDQEKQGIITQPEKMDEYVRENGFAGWFETSAKENINIDEAARALVNKILINDKLITADLADGDKFNLSSAGDATGSDLKNKCSC
ncbi:uncharacterized protein Dana_GF12008, isoform F [Drosophila ananassae]|uniref:Uncharacterized protein, isoform F n=1 Tax=Drosophila ananassae TaxID=7217 RepID=A0A0N8P053_DROAN|nr:ras and EF-hand domain-containing protein homolog isoform X1 [Drosophila ananassae]KPU76164.1 uncharacterized protein Dana_GF12008, isoform F [Drosophila ananassae]